MDILDRIDAAVGCQQCGGELGDSPSDDFCSEACQRRWRTEHHAEVLVGYREPWQRPEDFPGVGTEAHDTSGERGGFQRNYCPNPATSASLDGWIVRSEHVWTPGLNAMTYMPCNSEGCERMVEVGWLTTDLCPAHHVARRQANWRLPRQTGDLRADIRACNRARDLASTDAQRAAVRLRTKQLASRTRISLNVSMESMGRAFEQLIRDIGEAAGRVASALNRASPTPVPPAPRDESDPAYAMRRALEARQNRNTGPRQRPNAPRTIGRPTTAGRR